MKCQLWTVFADMQVVFRRDTDGDGIADTSTATLSGLNAQQIRETVKEVRVFILAQEGQKDRNFNFGTQTIAVGDTGLGSTFNLSTTIGSDWQELPMEIVHTCNKTKTTSVIRDNDEISIQ